MNIYICHNINHIYRSCIAAIDSKNDTTILIPTTSLIDKKLIDRINDNFEGIKFSVIDDRRSYNHRKILRYLFWFKFEKLGLLYLRISDKFLIHTIERNLIKIDTIFIFNDSLFLSELVMNISGNVDLIEEGSVNYLDTDHLYSKIEHLILRCLGLPFRLGRNKHIRQVFLENYQRAPKDLLRKSKYINLENNQLNLSQKMAFFNPIPDLKGETHKNTLIFALQDLTNCNLTAEESITTYQSIIGKLTKNDCLVLIKPHPNDANNYTKIKPGIVIDKNIPLEVLIDYLKMQKNLPPLSGISLIRSSIGKVESLIRWRVLIPNANIIEDLTRDELMNIEDYQP